MRHSPADPLQNLRSLPPPFRGSHLLAGWHPGSAVDLSAPTAAAAAATANSSSFRNRMTERLALASFELAAARRPPPAALATTADERRLRNQGTSQVDPICID